MRIPLGELSRRPQARRKRRKVQRSVTFRRDVIQPIPSAPRRARSAPRPTRRLRSEVAPIAERPPRTVTVSLPLHALGRFVAARWWAILTLAGLVALIAYASTDPRFFVYDANIVGVRHLDQETVYQAAGVDKQSIFWIDPGQVEERIAALPGVKHVRVRCTLPAVVTIRIVEREPIVLLRAHTQERDWWLDSEGVVLPYHGDPYAPQTLFVQDTSIRNLQVEDRIEPAGLVQSVTRLAQAIPEVQVFEYESDRGISFLRQSGDLQWRVIVGTSHDLSRKIQVLEVLDAWIEKEGIRLAYLDIRWPERPVLGRSGSGRSGGN